MSALDLPEFSYIALEPGQIRLLYVEFVSDEPVWTLKTVQLLGNEAEGGVEFEALSYAWGELFHTFPFVCSGGILRIHRNLNEALPYLARRSSSLPLWIDALSINQQDEEEKLVQIRMMNKIYRRASQVWVWLGIGPENIGEVLDLWRKVIDVAQKLEPLPYNSVITATSAISTAKVDLPHLSSPIWDRFYQVLESEWFNRLWIIQEVALARSVKIMCGRSELEWDLLCLTSREPELFQIQDIVQGVGYVSLIRKTFPGSVVFDVRRTAQKWIRNSPGPGEYSSSALDIEFVRTFFWITSRGTFQCSDPRDRVFGILGFIGEGQLAKLNIGLPASVVDLYTNFFRAVLMQDHIPEALWWNVLNMASTFDKNENLPFWVPDFHQQGPNFRPLRHLVNYEKSNGVIERRKASGTARSVSCGRSYRSIVLKGRIIDSLANILPEIPPERFISKDINRIVRGHAETFVWENDIARSVLGKNVVRLLRLNRLDFDEGVIDMYWRTLIGNDTEKFNYDMKYEAFLEFQKMAARVRAMLMQSGRKNVLADVYQEMQAAEVSNSPGLVFDNLLAIQVGRQLFLTKESRFGFAIRGIQSDDVVCVFNGAHFPHILRVVDKEKNMYRLIGEAYVHGIMNCEVDEMKIEEQDITLV
ncbi:hypothetical protein CC78DRAFT_618494 [Lojkania enalia]|uniref:Heterokaryon incompatibility domain-containing protein n=1 Tax=Lojkania enalia TaxID=147567 RepID=A0A9P4K3U1_9PLEO|nr:hypothetical protein CC78DRAFT_618494 [Didymosphaeria enalia]